MANTIISLDGEWQLSGRPDTGVPAACFDSAEFTIPATVPGNIEEDLHRAGIVADPYFAMNALELRKFEFYEWSYVREFDYAGAPGEVDLVFEGLDCCASVWVNDVPVGGSENAMTVQRFAAGRALRAGRNRISVYLASANNVFRKYPLEATALSAYPYNYESTRIRKPAHVWGWDITPRMALGGIFRSACLEEYAADRLVEGLLQFPQVNEKSATALYSYRVDIADREFKDLKIVLDGECGASRWHAEDQVWSAMGVVRFTVPEPALWWPRHYGEANLYTVTVRLVRGGGQVLFEEQFNCGIRHIELLARPTHTDSAEPDFQFIVNGVPVRIFGTNHVPLDALHSHDLERLPRFFEMAADLDCNMVRCWGGGIYEPDEFYRHCDREGILVWQDFMMGCAIYPVDGEFRRVLRQEVEQVVRRLRQHPSIALWAGDNECDCMTYWALPFDPNFNQLTREVLPEVCHRCDPLRPYLASSPWYSPEAVRQGRELDMDPGLRASEQHLWGPRDYFKSDFYRNTRASFASEIGYHGCPGVTSIRRFIPEESLWPWRDNDMWNYHASNPFITGDRYLNYRTGLMADQIREMFGIVPATLEEFALASQICQAEAKKFFIELVRSRPGMSGILWWNLLDGWPQFSDAVVDYYFNRKLAYHYIKRVQQAVVLILPEADAWMQKLLGVNDSREAVSGSYRVWDAESGEEFASGRFELAPGEIAEITAKRCCTTEKRLWLIEWRLDSGIRGVNHAMTGHPQFELGRYRECWLPALAALDGAFDAAQVGQ